MIADITKPRASARPIRYRRCMHEAASSTPAFSGAIVTGGSSGIGRGIVRGLLARGVPVLAVALHADELAALATLDGATRSPLLHTLALDLGAPGAVDRVLAASEPLDLDLLVNCAGVGVWGEHVDVDRVAVQRMLAVNVAALTELCAVVGARLRERGRGTILNVASTAAFQPLPWLAAYSASKHYVAAFSAALARELAPHGVRVCVLHLGTTRTAFLAGAGIAAATDGDRVGQLAHRFAMDPEVVAERAVLGLLRGESVIVPGLVNRAHRLLAHILPTAWISRLFAWLARPGR
jgi:short-subunit dehydrogenase